MQIRPGCSREPWSVNHPGGLTWFLAGVACTGKCSHCKQQALRRAGLHLKQKGTVKNLFSVSKADLETQMKSESAVRQVVRHGILNKTWKNSSQ